MERPSVSYKREIGAVAWSALFLFLFISLASYSPYDNSLFHYGSARHGFENWAGFLGAHIASILFLVFGAAVYGLLALFLVPAYRFFFSKYGDTEERFLPCRLQVLALASMVLLSAIILDLCGIIFHGGSAGGLFGAWAASWLAFCCGTQGTLIAASALSWICLCYGLQISLINLWVKVWGGLTFVAGMMFQALRGAIWYLATRRQPVAAQPQPVEIPVTEEAKDLDFWAAVTSGQPQSSEEGHGEALQGIALDDQIETVEARWITKKIATVPRHTKLFTVPFAYVPNSVLNKNIFILGDGQLQSLYAVMMTINQGAPQLKKKRIGFVLPEVTVGQEQAAVTNQQVVDDATQRSTLLESKLLHFGVKGKVASVKPGPVITLFEYKPDIDSKISKITALEDDLAMALTANSIRIIAPIPGKDAVGFEIANNTRADVLMERIVQSKEWTNAKARLPILLGVDVVGNPMIQDLVSMPHLLVGGSTGSGKSVGLNVMLMSLLYKMSPDMLKLILIDPKRLEFTPYADIPHLLFPIVTQPAKAISVLKWVVHEMESRYECMSKAGVRNMGEYQAWYKQASKTKDDMTAFRPLPFLVVIIDELADLMMVGGKDVETHIVRIVQMARAAGIHMIIATQRPSVDVVTGLIKINFPSRIAFRVSSKVDSRTILDCQGAEKLLGRGDMLFMHSASPELKRVHGAYVTDEQIETMAQFWRDQAEPEYIDMSEVVALDQKQEGQDYQDELYDQVLDFIKQNDEISISMIQRQYRIGFNRSARLIEKLEGQGLIAPAQGSKPRKVLR